jgi:hypothetical protein
MMDYVSKKDWLCFSNRNDTIIKVQIILNVPWAL